MTDANETITDTASSPVDHNCTYQYDMLSQLIDANVTNIGSYDWVRDVYSYDKAGNLQSHRTDTSTGSGTPATYGYLGDLMTEANGVTLDWDWNGNMLNLPYDATDVDLIYNWDNKLRYGEYGTDTIDLKYDPDGNRIWKKSSVNGERKYIVDIVGDLPVILMELDATDYTVKKTYIYANGQILAQHNGLVAQDNKYFYLHDRLGSIRQLIDRSGNVARYYTYEPFGAVLESGGSFDNAFMFTGQWFDSEINEYYLRARQYDPHIGRFTARDPVQGKFHKPLTLHRYLYCLNDPVNLTDPRGEIVGWVALVIGTTIGEAFRHSEAYYKYAAYGYAVAAIGTIYELAVFWDLPEDIAEWLGIEEYTKRWFEEYESIHGP